MLLEERRKHLESINDISRADTLPHSNPTVGDHKLTIEIMGCNTFCDLNLFFSPSSRLTVELLRALYGEDYSGEESEYLSSIGSFSQEKIKSLFKGSDSCQCSTVDSPTYSIISPHLRYADTSTRSEKSKQTGEGIDGNKKRRESVPKKVTEGKSLFSSNVFVILVLVACVWVLKSS